MSKFAEDHLIPSLEPWLNPDLEIFANAVGTMFDPLSSIVEDSLLDPGWGSVLNPQTFPAAYDPNYLGQYVGVQAPPGLTNAEDLSLIAEEQGFSRGTSTSIILAATRGLKPGAPKATLLERKNFNREEDAYHFLVQVHAADIGGALSTTGNVAAGSDTIKVIPSTAGFQIGQQIVALGLAPGTTITEVKSTTEIKVSNKSAITKTGVTLVVSSATGSGIIVNNVNFVK